MIRPYHCAIGRPAAQRESDSGFPVACPITVSNSPSRLERLASFAAAVPPRWIAAVAGIAITASIVFGILQRAIYPTWTAANLDSELSAGTWVSAVLLWSTTAGWVLVAGTERPPARYLWLWSILLGWLAIDEGAAIHERAERWSGIDWQVLYVPILGIGAVAWWLTLRRYREHRRFAVLLIAGTAAWAGALLLELIQNWGGKPVPAIIYDPAMITEEALEMTGATMLLISAVLVLQTRRLD